MSKMDFKIGQKVQETENGLVGIIKDIKNDFFSFNSGSFTQDELIYYSFGTETMREIKKLERHPLFEIAENSQLLVYKDKVYSLSGESKEKKQVAEVVSLSDLNDLYFQRNAEGIQKIKERFSKRVLNYFGLGYTKEETTIPLFVFEKVFPHFDIKKQEEKQKDKLSKLFGCEETMQKPKTKRIGSGDLEKATQYLFEKVEHMRESIDENYSFRQENPSLCMENKNFILFNNGFYPKSSSGENFDLKLDGKSLKNDFYFNKSGTIKKTEKFYQEAFSKKIRRQALENLTKEKISKILRKKGRDLIVGNLIESHRKNYGFFSGGYDEGRDYFVYLKIPGFGIVGFFDDEQYYNIFEPSRIFIEVSKDGKGFHYDKDIFMINEMDYECADFNAFYPSDYGPLCLGKANIPKEGRDIGEVVAKRLKKVKQMILEVGTGDWDGGIYYDASLDEIRKRKFRIRKAKYERG